MSREIYIILTLAAFAFALAMAFIMNSSASGREYCYRPAGQIMYYTTNGVDPIVCPTRTPTPANQYCPMPQ